jgi:Protein of unknown function (DUF3575)
MISARSILAGSVSLFLASNALAATKKSSGKRNIQKRNIQKIEAAENALNAESAPQQSQNLAMNAPSSSLQQSNNSVQGSPFNYRIATNPIGTLIWGNVNVAADFRINSQLSAGPELNYRSYGFGGIRTTFYGIGGNVRKTFWNDDVFSDSFYVKGFGNYYTLRFSSDYSGETSDYSWNLFTMGSTAGYQWFLRNGLNFEVGGGLQYTYVNFGDYVGNKFYVGGIWPALDASIGYAF